MVNQSVTAFSRTFANRDLFSGPARWAVVWSVGAALLLACLLVTVGLLVGLLTERGALVVNLTHDELEEFTRFTGLKLRHLGPEHEAVERLEEGPEPAAEVVDSNSEHAGTPRGKPLVGMHVIEEEGILGSVWRTHGRWYGPAFSWMYRHLEWLRHNDFALVTLLLAAIAFWLLRQLCLAQILYQSQVASVRVAALFRKNLHRQAMRLGPEDLEEHSGQSIIQLFDERVEAVRNGLETWIHRLSRYPLEIASAVFIACQIDLRLAIEWSIPLGLCWLLIQRAETRLAASRLLVQDRSRKESQELAQQLSKARLVRGFGMEQVEHEDFVKRLDRSLKPSQEMTSAQRDAVGLRWLTALICAVILLFLLLSLGLKLLHTTGEISWPGAVVFGVAAAITLYGVRQLWDLRQVKEEISAAAQPIFRYLDRLPSVSQAVGAKFLQPLSRSLHFDAVTYRTPSQRLLLDRLTLKLDAKKSYAVVSLDPIEAKASALMLPRFLEPQSGRVLIDGEDIAWATLESLRAEAIYVGGDDPPLRGTVLENLCAGNSQYTIQQATEAAKTAHAHQFIVKMPQGYETVLSGGTDELDASQRFRLSLARAVLRNPALLVIEEPQFALDEDTKQLMDDTYQRILPGRTMIFLPARLTTMKRVDQIVLLQNGQIAAHGTQAELVADSPLYRHWEYMHFHEFRHHEPVTVRA